jgi:hypothetical protein
LRRQRRVDVGWNPSAPVWLGLDWNSTRQRSRAHRPDQPEVLMTWFQYGVVFFSGLAAFMIVVVINDPDVEIKEVEEQRGDKGPF